MTRYEKFLEALDALCVEHGMRMDSECIDWDQEEQYIELATEAKPACCNIQFVERIAPTPEELAAQAAENAERDRASAARYEELRRRHEEYINTPDYKARVALVEREAKRQREDYMRISTDPTDPAFIDARPRRVWCNNVEVLGWTVADEFRRCVITAAGVMNGAVLIERLGESGAPVVEAPGECSTSLSGMFVKVPKAAVEVVEAPEPTFAVPTVPVKAAAMSTKKRKKGR